MTNALQHVHTRYPGLVDSDLLGALYYHTICHNGWNMGWTKSGGKIYYDLGDGTTGSDQNGVSHDYADTSDKIVKIWSLDGWGGCTQLWMNGHSNTNYFPDLTSLRNLTFLDASYNTFTGNLPDLSACTGLTYYVLNGNTFSGSIPDLSALTALLNFNIGDNPSISESIPSFAACTALQIFIITNTAISGTIPSFNTCTALQYFYASQTSVSGTLPSFSNCTALIEIRINDTTISGTMPSFNTCTTLQVCDMQSARFTGTIPTFSACTDLVEFYVPMNVGTGFTAYTSGAFTTQKNMNILNLYGSSLPEAHIDQILADLVTSLGGGRVTCYVSLNGGSNAHPSATGLANRATLITAGWTVDIN